MMLVSKKDLLGVTRVLQQTVKDDPRNPEYSAFRFTGLPDKDGVRVALYDGIVSATISLPASHIDEKFDIVVPSRQFVAAVRLCPDEDVQLEAGLNNLAVYSGSFSTEISTRNGLDVRPFYLSSPKTVLKCAYGKLADTLKTCSWVIARGMENQQFANVHFKSTGEEAVFVALASYAVMEVSVEYAGPSAAVALPPRFCSLLESLGLDRETEVELQVGDNESKLALYVPGYLFVSSPVVKVSVPAYEKYFAQAQSESQVFPLSPEEFSEMLARVVGFANLDGSNPYVELRLEDGVGAMKCTTATTNTAESFEYDDEGIEYGSLSFNGAVFNQALKRMLDARVFLPPPPENAAATPLTAIEDNKRFLLQQVRQRS